MARPGHPLYETDPIHLPNTPSPVDVATALWRYPYNTTVTERVDALIAKRWPGGVNSRDRGTWLRDLVYREGGTPFSEMDEKTRAAYVACALEWSEKND